MILIWFRGLGCLLRISGRQVMVENMSRSILDVLNYVLSLRTVYSQNKIGEKADELILSSSASVVRLSLSREDT